MKYFVYRNGELMCDKAVDYDYNLLEHWGYDVAKYDLTIQNNEYFWTISNNRGIILDRIEFLLRRKDGKEN